MFTIDIPSGYVLAVFFVVFDVICLAITDVLLTRFVCALYYRDIHAGNVIDVHSLDIPGIVNYLVGKWFSFANLVTLFIKITLITFVFFINFKVNSTDGFEYKMERRKATYDFVPTDAEWGSGNVRAVARRAEFTRLSCREFDGDKVTFYRSVFNLTDDLVLLDETNVPNATNGIYPVNDDSFLCVSPRHVRDSNADPILFVKGCSSLGTTTCANSTEYRRTVTSVRPIKSLQFPISAGTGVMGYGAEWYNNTDIARVFPEYVNPSLFCLQQCFGIQNRCCRTREDTNCRKIITPCLIVAEDREKNETLFERWLLENEMGSSLVLVRTHPGPIIAGVYNFGVNRKSVALLDVQTSVNWWEYAGVLLTDSFVYRYAPRVYERKEPTRPTFIPLESIVLGALMLCILIFGAVGIGMTIGTDERPRFNTVNGLSSILREEHSSTGNSYREGASVLLGFSHRASGKLHLGPVNSADVSVARGGDTDIE